MNTHTFSRDDTWYSITDRFPTDSSVHTAAENTDSRSHRRSLRIFLALAEEFNADQPVAETGVKLIDEMYADGFFTGRNRLISCGAALYLAQRIHEAPIDASAIADRIEDCTRREITQYSIDLRSRLSIPVPPAYPTDFVDDFASRINNTVTGVVSDRVTELAKELLNAADQTITTGRNPTVLAAAAIYAATLITGEKPATQKEISNAVDVSTVSIRDVYSEFLKLHDPSTTAVNT